MAQLLLSETIHGDNAKFRLWIKACIPRFWRVPGTTFGVFVPCGLGEGTDLLVPVLTCAAPRFLQGGDIQCFCEMMALLLLAGKTDFDNATFQLWLVACHTPKLE